MRTALLALISTTAAALAACHASSAGAPDAAAPPADAAAAAPDAAPAPGLTLLPYAIAVDVTPDGRTAVFEDLTSTTASIVFVDTVTGQATTKTTVGDPSRDVATGVSAGGRVTALHGDPVQAGLWTEAGGWTDVASPYGTPCDQDVAGGWDISADGSVMVGLVWHGCAAEAFRWVDGPGGGTFTPLAVLGTAAAGATLAPTNRATVVSDDGKVAAGFAQNGMLDRTPAMWDATGAGTLLDPNNTDAPGEVLSIDADGKVLAGISGGNGFVWTKGTGLATMVRLDAALPTDPVYPNAMTADGRVIFGGVGDAFSGSPIAFVWTGPDGMRALADVAAAAGVALPDGVLLNSVLGASADGSVLVGTATDAKGAAGTFVLRLPAPPAR